MPESRPLVSAQQVSGAFLLGGVGSVALILGILLLSTTRPQGRLVPVDDTQHRALLSAAESSLSGFGLHGDGGARLDVRTAMELVVERGVTLKIHPGGVAPND
jgi:hypothetical protein